MTDQLIAPGLVHVYANWGRWIADCANPYCGSKLVVVPFAEGFVCSECRQSTTVAWPSAALVASIERVLLMRPDRRTQNWFPGETTEDLYSENMAHGIMADYAANRDDGPLIAMEDGIISMDNLPMLNPRRELAG